SSNFEGVDSHRFDLDVPPLYAMELSPRAVWAEEDKKWCLVLDPPDYLPELQLVQEYDGGTTLQLVVPQFLTLAPPGPSVQSPKIHTTIRGPSDAAASQIRPRIAEEMDRELQSLGPYPSAQFAQLYCESVGGKPREELADAAGEPSELVPVGEGNEIY
ncbi:hypothetical protein CPC08DRAFT_723412, partial [Agrocybe pediades]